MLAESCQAQPYSCLSTARATHRHGFHTTAMADLKSKTGLDDPRALEILTTEHWSLLSARTLGYQEMFGRATIFVAILSGTIVALALLAQATRFGREALVVAALLLAVVLFIGLATFLRSVAINYEDARWVEGMNLLRRAYLEIVPDLEPYFVTGHPPGNRPPLGHGSLQHPANLARSLTTTSSVIAALNSVLVGALVATLAVLFDVRPTIAASFGAVISIASAISHVRYAARFRQAHSPTAGPPSAG